MEKVKKARLDGILKKKAEGTMLQPLKLDLQNNCADLNKIVSYKPDNSFLIRVSGDSMVNAGISSGDIVLVNKSAKAQDGDIIMASVNDNLVIKRLKHCNGAGYMLMPENKDYGNIKIQPEDKFEICGVVTTVIKMFYTKPATRVL
ncbi:MAG: hypothetical protein M1419_02250 [Bacteroidetes bacterium]|nr:hypothetical protein [Bacteroidota bacterium]